MNQLVVGLCMGNLRPLSVFFVLISLCGFIPPNSSTAASLNEIYQQAQLNDPTFLSANFQKMAIEEGRKQAISQYLPTLTASADYTDTSQDIVSSDNEVFGSGKTDFDTTSYGLTLTQPILRWDSIVGLKQSKLANFQAAAEYVLAEQELVFRVAELYLNALSAKDMLDYALVEQSAIEKHYELARSRQEMGLIPITDLYDAKARLATTQAETIAARNRVDDSLQALTEVTSERIENLAPLQSKIPINTPEPSDLTLWIDQAMQHNTSIEFKKYAVAVAEQEVRRHKAGHFPTLDLVGRFQSETTDGTLFGGGSEVDRTDIKLELNIPLYKGGYVNSRVREAGHQLSSAQQELDKQRRSVSRQTRSAYLKIESDLSRIEALNQSVVSNQLALDAKNEGFMSGLFTSLSVLDAERDLSQVSIDYAQARYDYILNSLKLKQAVGTLNSQDVFDLDQWFVK